MKQNFKYVLGVIIFIIVLIGLNMLYYKVKDLGKEKIEQNTISNLKPALQQAKDFTVETENGKKVKLSDFKGKPIILNFWASWCGPCQMEMSDFDKVYKEEKDNIQFMMINATIDDIKEEAIEYIKNNKFSFPIYYDIQGMASYAYYITGYPTSYFINSDFEIVKQYNGMMTQEILRKNIEQIK